MSLCSGQTISIAEQIVRLEQDIGDFGLVLTRRASFRDEICISAVHRGRHFEYY